MKRRTNACGQVLVEYILLSVLLLGATVFVLRFVVHEVFGESLPQLGKKTTQCVSKLRDPDCK